MQFCVELSPPWTRNLTTLERVKAAAVGPLDNLGQPIPGQKVNLPADEEVIRLIAVASSLIETHIHRPNKLLQTQYREYVPGTGGPTIRLFVTPILSIESITLRDQPLIADWLVNPVDGILLRPQGWEFTGKFSRNIEDTRAPGSESPDFIVDYTGGYVSPAQGEWDPHLPPEMEQAAIVSILQWAQTQTQNLSIQRVRIGDFTTTFSAGVSNSGGVRALPNPAIDLLAPYRRLD